MMLRFHNDPCPGRKTRPLLRWPLMACGALLLSGCAIWPAVGPDYQPPTLAVPATWQNATSTAADSQHLAQWWTQLHDTQLDVLVAAALAGNKDLQIAQARLREARAARQQARAAYAPTISASTGATRSKTSAKVQAAPQKTLYDAGFDASWEIDIFGGTRRAVEAAEADLAANAADLAQVRVSLLAEVAQNYIDYRSAQARLTIARSNLASQTETAQITEWRYQAGLVGASDVEQARTSREQTRAGIPDLEVSLSEAENRLAVLTGQAPGVLHDMLAKPAALPAVPSGVATGIPADVLRQRPDLISAERTLAAETARVGQKLAQRFPSLSLSGTFGWQSYSLGALGVAESVYRSLGGSLAASLFDGGRLRAQVEAQSAVQAQALLSYESAVLGALEEVENALVAHARAHERVAARHAAAESARSAAQLTRNMYQAGLADFQKVLETQRTQLSAEDSLASAEASLLTSLVTIYKTLGGGWDAADKASMEKQS